MFLDSISFYEKDKKLFSPDAGFLLGNMFKDEYKGYKNYRQEKIKYNSEKEELLLKIYEYDFAINDLSLWLDLHPDDKSIYNEFKNYTDYLKELVQAYERKYGPLEISCSDYDNYLWYKGPWPFEGGFR